MILVSRQSLLDTRRTVLTVPLTSYRGQKMLPVHVLIRVPDGGIRNDSLAVADQMRAIDKSRLGALIGTLSAEALREVELAIAMALDLP